jgi:hypothetical protein
MVLGTNPTNPKGKFIIFIYSINFQTEDTVISVSLTMSLQLSMWKPLGFFWTLAVPQT